MDKSTGLDIPHRDRRTFSVRAEEDRAIWRACHRLDRMWETQREPQDTCDRVVDANGTIIAGSNNHRSAPATDGSHARETPGGTFDSS